MGVLRENVLILRANHDSSGCRTFLSLLFFPSFLFPCVSPSRPVLPLLFWPLPRASFSRSRDKTAQVGFHDKTEKSNGVYLCTRDYFIVAHCYTRGISLLSPLFPSRTRTHR